MNYNEIRNKIETEAKKRYYQDIENIKKTVDRHYKIHIVYHIVTFIMLAVFEFIYLTQKKYIICFILISIKICLDQIIKHIYDYVYEEYDDHGTKMLLLKTNLLKYKFDVIKEFYSCIDINTLKHIIDPDIINVCFVVLQDEIIPLQSICDNNSSNIIGKIDNVEIDCDLFNDKIVINYVKIHIK